MLQGGWLFLYVPENVYVCGYVTETVVAGLCVSIGARSNFSRIYARQSAYVGLY